MLIFGLSSLISWMWNWLWSTVFEVIKKFYLECRLWRYHLFHACSRLWLPNGRGIQSVCSVGWKNMVTLITFLLPGKLSGYKPRISNLYICAGICITPKYSSKRPNIKYNRSFLPIINKFHTDMGKILEFLSNFFRLEYKHIPWLYFIWWGFDWLYIFIILYGANLKILTIC